MANLYQISAEIEAILEADGEELVDQETGEILTEEQQMQMLDALQMDFNTKVSNIARYIKNVTTLADALKKEKMEMAKRQAAAERKAERLKEYLKYCLHEQKFSTGTTQISFRKNPAALVITDAESLPVEYREIIPETWKPNNAAIKEALKAGETISGAELVQGTSVTIKC